MHLKLITPDAQGEPVTLDEAKLAARIDGDEFDDLLPGLIRSARQVAEQETGRHLVGGTYRLELFDWPAGDVITLGGWGDATGATVRYWSGTGWTELTEAVFEFGSYGADLMIAPADRWPTLGERRVGARVIIDVEAASEASEWECVRLYIKALVAWWVQNPAAASERSASSAPFLGSLLDPARSWC